MKRVIKLTESDLRLIVKRVLKEQAQSGGNMDLTNKDITVVVKSTPYQEVKGRINSVRDIGNNQKRISYVLDNGDKGEAQYDSNRMEFDNYRIVNIDGKQVNTAVKSTPQVKKPQPVAQKPAQPQGKQYVPQQTINRIKGAKPQGKSNRTFIPQSTIDRLKTQRGQ